MVKDRMSKSKAKLLSQLLEFDSKSILQLKRLNKCNISVLEISCTTTNFGVTIDPKKTIEYCEFPGFKGQDTPYFRVPVLLGKRTKVVDSFQCHAVIE
jgi:hypothetical protein